MMVINGVAKSVWICRYMNGFSLPHYKVFIISNENGLEDREPRNRVNLLLFDSAIM